MSDINELKQVVIQELRKRLPEEFQEKKDKYGSDISFVVQDWKGRWYSDKDGGIQVGFHFGISWSSTVTGIELTVSAVGKECARKSYVVKSANDLKPLEQAVALCLKRRPRAKELYEAEQQQEKQEKDTVTRVVELLKAEGLDVNGLAAKGRLDGNGKLMIAVNDRHYCNYKQAAELYNILSGARLKLAIDMRLTPEQYKDYQQWIKRTESEGK